VLAALLLNLGAGTQPQAPPQIFGGGPFWKEYGYDSAYDEIREQTLSTTGPARCEVETPPFVCKPIDYCFIQDRAFGSVAHDMRAFWQGEIAERRNSDEEELMIFLLLSE
jgi:hypothetical protein